jgi:hypothetical protein
MSGSEIMVSLVFLLLGYWLVSYFIERWESRRKPPPPAAKGDGPGNAEP